MSHAARAINTGSSQRQKVMVAAYDWVEGSHFCTNGPTRVSLLVFSLDSNGGKGSVEQLEKTWSSWLPVHFGHDYWPIQCGLDRLRALLFPINVNCFHW